MCALADLRAVCAVPSSKAACRERPWAQHTAASASSALTNTIDWPASTIASTLPRSSSSARASCRCSFARSPGMCRARPAQRWSPSRRSAGMVAAQPRQLPEADHRVHLVLLAA